MRIENLLKKMKTADQTSGRKPVVIPEILIERLKPFGKRFIKITSPIVGDDKSGKAAFEREFQNHPYKADDPEIQSWLVNGGNYGVLGGKGLIFIETDNKRMTKRIENRFKTLTVQSGSGRGKHFAFYSNISENGILINPKTNENLGNIQANNKYIVGANCHHNSGGVYKIVDDSPIEYISKEEVTEIFGDYLVWTGAKRKQLEEQSLFETEQIGVAIPLSDLVDMSELQIKGDEFQGSHPIHGSKTGQNFCVNLKKNVWHCFRCNSGGGGLMWIAVKEGLLKCHEAQKGALKGEKFLKAVKAAEEMGFNLKLYDEDLSPDVERFFEEVGNHSIFRPAYVADELMKEYVYVTRIRDKMMFRYVSDTGVHELFADVHAEEQTRRKIGKHTSIRRQKEVVNFIKVSTYKNLKEAPPYLLPVQNGILNLTTGKLEDFNPDYFILNASPAIYDPKAKCPLFMKFLSEIVDPQDALTLQEYAGFCLWREYTFHRALLLVGEGANGKSTFLNVLIMLIGKENIVNTPLQTLNTNRFSRGRLYGKMANICPDLPAIAMRDVGKFKQMTGQDPMTGEYKFRDEFTFWNYAKLVFACNQIPKSPEDTTAFFRRWLIINFPNKFPEGDPKTDTRLAEKLTTPEELSGILNWALEGLQRLIREQHFTTSKTVEETRRQYVEGSDPIKAFVETQLEPAAGNFEPRNDVYNAFLKWCRKRKLPTVGKAAFSSKLPQYIPTGFARPRILKKQVRCWRDIRLVSKSETLEPHKEGIPLLLNTSEKKLPNVKECVKGSLGGSDGSKPPLDQFVEEHAKEVEEPKKGAKWLQRG